MKRRTVFAALLDGLSRRVRRAPMRALFCNFRSNSRGNVAVISALAALPMVAAVGCVIDYTTASMIKTKLQAAADSASLAAVSNSSSVVATAKNMTGNGAVSGGSTYALSFFNANLSTAPENTGYTSLSPTATVAKSGTTVTATVAFTAQVPTYFMGLVGYQNVAVSGTSTASYTLPTFIDFYLMLDVSGSMGFPSTSSEQTRLEAVNPDNYSQYPGGCTFACHFTDQGVCGESGQGPTQPPVGSATNPKPGGYCQGFVISRLGTTSSTGGKINWSNSQVSSCASAGTTSCIQLRADAVGYAVNTLLQTAYNTEQSTGVSNEFRVGLYPFIDNLYAYSSLTASLTPGSQIYNAAANLASLLDTGTNSNLGSGGTHFDNAFPSMNNVITHVGNGSSSSNTLPYVFLVSDGVDNSQTYSPFTGSNPQLFSTSLCSTLKNRGIKVAVLYIPYQPIQNPTTFAGSEDINVNALIPPESTAVPDNLQSCASPNFFYTANTPADINNALVTMFEQAVSTAHITN
jgi:Flp pilus assembly protein TadG